jgi:hypothetical protein
MQESFRLLPLIAPGRIDLWKNAALAGCEQALFSIPAERQVPDFPWYRVFEHAVGNDFP